MTQPALLIRGARVLRPGADPHKPPVADVLIRGDRIAAVAGSDDPPLFSPGMETLDGSRKLLIPGLVSAHYHSHDTLLKGRFEDMPLDVWVLHAQPAYWGRRTRQELRLRTLLGAMEALKAGITTVQDMNSLVPQDEETLDTILAACAGTGVILNPLSNLKLKNGVAPISAFRRAGVPLALGCDNNSCSDCQNLFQAMKLATLIAAGVGRQPDRHARLRRGHRRDHRRRAGAVGLADQVGVIAPGMKADLVLLDLDDLAWQPFASASRQLVYSETGRAVHTVLVDGRVVLRAGRLTTVDEGAFRGELAEVMEAIERDLGALTARVAPGIPPLLEANAALSRRDLGMDRLIPR